MKTNFSNHALQRVNGRISLSHSDLAAMLNYDLALDIGAEPQTNRVHKLFYSPKDFMCFVAIQDVKTGTVITVLPLDYHECIAWKVSVEAQNKAKQLMGRNVQVVQHEQAQTKTKFKLSGVLVDDFGAYIKVVNLGSWNCADYDNNPEVLIDDDDFSTFLANKVSKVQEQGHLTKLILRKGQHDMAEFEVRDVLCSASVH